MPSDSGRLDDPSIPGEEALYRRLANAASTDFVVTDPVTGVRIPSSGVFKTNDADGISVYLDSVLSSAGLQPADLLRAPNNAVCSVRAEAARTNGLGVVRDPWPSDADDPTHPRHGAHALITGTSQLGPKAARRVARSLASNSTMVLDPGT
ncbi:MAG: hypothetical protein DLM58_12935 [Pseudonocardiales bacterium]|nr:MAG: hypothetical protein DLM58_12935 [Pseudonocardiales bacterium]